ncbi:MAG: peptide synthetase [Deltaproteobacteria bacterium]|nr:MAG: peptide synthetase [Deltaproteobacteria bacterium]
MSTLISRERALRWQAGERLDLLFEQQCDILVRNGEPDHPAIIIDDSAISYPALDQRANQLARYLLRQGISSGHRVGILLEEPVDTYVSLLAILKINAAYVPLDTGFPEERIAFIASDADLATILTVSVLNHHLDKTDVPPIFLDTAANTINTENTLRLTGREKESARDSLCYIIYTSGTTGNPKGVAIEHPGICNFVRVAGDVYGIKKDDRVYQGITIAFDFSVEEIWVPLIAGATLIPKPTRTCCLGADLADFLNRQKVTAMCCVPTLLATIEEDIPSLRLLMVGGEACPRDLVARWHRPGRTMLNTYGPTEATVTATWSELRPDKPVTIGRPMPTYSIVILDENQQPVPPGAAGEICIAGIGLARGYVKRSRLTRTAFIPDFLDIPANPSRRLYRTGDLGRLNTDGEIEYMGRIDTQVKIRGYRIELTEIESVLLQIPQIEQAVVSTFTPGAGPPELVAYCRLKKDVFDLPGNIAAILAKRLPGYMIPAYIEKISDIPVLPSNKVNRKELPPPTGPRFISAGRDFVAAKTGMEKKIARAVAKALDIEQISIEDNFFTDLGGHSLAMAMAASQLRTAAGLSAIGLSDFYQYPTVHALAAYVEEKASDTENQRTGKNRRGAENSYRPATWQVRICGTGQLLSIFAYLGLLSLPLVLLIRKLVSLPLQHPADALWIIVQMARTTGITLALSLAFPVALKWILLGRVRAGKYRLWGWFFFRWWLVEKMIALSPHPIFKGTPLLGLYFRLMGARIGSETLIDTPCLHIPDLITVGRQTSIGHSTHLFGYEVYDGFLHCRPVVIGQGCFVGSNTVIMPGTRLADAAWLGDQSLLPTGGTIAECENWSGSPAARKSRPDRRNREIIAALKNRFADTRRGPGWRVSLGALLLMPILFLVPFSAMLAAIGTLVATVRACGGYGYLLGTLPAGIAFVVFLSLFIALVMRITRPRIEAGLYPVDSWRYVRKWAADTLMEMSLMLTNTLYATLYLPPLLRLLGARIGKRTEIATIAHITPSMLTVGDESFLADIAHLGPSYSYLGLFGIEPIRIGRRSFVGNAAFVPGGRAIVDESLIGVLSVPSEEAMPTGSTWLGVPAFRLPRRQCSRAFDESLTYIPPRDLYVKRLGYEFFRIILPGTLFSLSGSLFWVIFAYLFTASTFWTAAALSSGFFLVSGIGITAIVVLIKKILIGTYRPRVKPLWDVFVRRSELVTGLYESAVVPALLAHLTGTPFAAPLLRLFGVRIGQRCFLETTFITEFDLVEIDDDTSVGLMCSLQTHLFEDRVMKMSRVIIGAGCSIGPRAVVLYDTVLENGVRLDPLSLVMKGEILPADTHWRGSPADRVLHEYTPGVALAVPDLVHSMIPADEYSQGLPDTQPARAN